MGGSLSPSLPRKYPYLDSLPHKTLPSGPGPAGPTDAPRRRAAG